MGGFGSILSALATPAAGATSRYLQGRRERDERQQTGFMEQLKMLRQARQDEEQGNYRRAQMANLESLARERERPDEEAFTGQPFEGEGAEGARGYYLRGSVRNHAS